MDTGSTFTGNAATEGQLYCESCTAYFLGSKFYDQLAGNASIALMHNAATVTFDGCDMLYGKARKYGGAIYGYGSGSATLTFANCP